MSMSDTHWNRAAENRHYRDLWVAVVRQAKDDIDNEPLDSINFTQAVAFFIGGGDWVQNRTAIGDYLDMHRDDLEKLGRRCINERRILEGLQPLLPQRPWPTPTHVLKTAKHQSGPQPAFSPAPRLQPAAPQVSRCFPHGIHTPPMSGDRAA